MTVAITTSITVAITIAITDAITIAITAAITIAITVWTMLGNQIHEINSIGLVNSMSFACKIL